ncbi:MAG: TIR domain-containing protein [Rhizomicrobium sp.]
MADIFISYAREDREWVSKLADAIQAEGYTVWWDWDLLVGKRYRETIETELQVCKATVVVWSQHSIKSDFVRDEAEEGQQRNILVPVLKESVRPPAGFRQLQTADFSTWTGGTGHAEYQRMMKGLSHLIGRPGRSNDEHVDAAPAPIVPPEPTQPVPIAEAAPAPVVPTPAPVAPATVVQAKAPEPVHSPVLAPPAKKPIPVIGYVAIGVVALIAVIFVASFVVAQFTPAPKPKPATILPAVHGTPPASGTSGTAHPTTPPAGETTPPPASSGDEAGNTRGSSRHGGGTATPTTPAAPEPPSGGGDTGDAGQDVGQSH